MTSLFTSSIRKQRVLTITSIKIGNKKALARKTQAVKIRRNK